MLAQQTGHLFGLDRLSAVRPAQGQIQARYFRGLNTLLRQRGADPREILGAHGIDPIAFSDPDSHLDCMAMASTVEWCSHYLNDPLFGLHLAECQEVDVFGTVAVLARSAPNFRGALQALIDYLPVLHSPEGPLWLTEGTGSIEIHWIAQGNLRDVEQATYQGSFLLLKLFRMLSGDRYRPRYVGLCCDMSARTIGLFQDRLGCTVFRHEENVASFDAAILSQPIATSNSMIFELLGGYLANAEALSKPILKEQVDGYIRSALPTGMCTIDRCAARIGISTRLLQKRLAAIGLNFLLLVEQERVELAKRALLSTNESLDNIALSLGYSDQACFGRAFKRWTGTTPKAFRARTAAN